MSSVPSDMDFLPNLPDFLVKIGQAFLGLGLVTFSLLISATPVLSHKLFNYGMRVTSAIAGAVMLYSVFTDDTGRGIVVWLIASMMAFIIFSTMSVRQQLKAGKKIDE